MNCRECGRFLISVPVSNTSWGLYNTSFRSPIFAQSSLQCGESTWPNDLSAQSLLLFLAPHQVGFFRISRFIPDGFCSNKVQIPAKNSSSFWQCKHYSAIWTYLLTLGEYFASKFMYIVLVAQVDICQFLRIWPDCRTVLTPPERAWFSPYSALYLNKFHLVGIEIF